MSNCTFTRPVLAISRTTGEVLSSPWWVAILRWIAMNPGHTSRDCRYAICSDVRRGKWDRFATNTWADAVRTGLIKPTRTGRTFVYSCTSKGLDKVVRTLDYIDRKNTAKYSTNPTSTPQAGLSTMV